MCQESPTPFPRPMTWTPGRDVEPDDHVIITHNDRADSRLLFVSISDLWVMVIRRYNDGHIVTRLQKVRRVSGADDELADLSPIV